MKSAIGIVWVMSGKVSNCSRSSGRGDEAGAGIEGVCFGFMALEVMQRGIEQRYRSRSALRQWRIRTRDL